MHPSGISEACRVSASANERLAFLAEWSPWCPFEEAERLAPRRPGVYLARQRADGPLVYVGKASERSDGGGLWRRLRAYRSGKAITNGLGEAIFDRALANHEWLQARLAEVEAGAPMRTAAWGRVALQHAELYLCWATTADGDAATVLERRVLDALAEAPLWNRSR